MDTIFIKHLFSVWCRVYTDFYLIENFSGEDCTYVCYAQLWIMRYIYFKYIYYFSRIHLVIYN